LASHLLWLGRFTGDHGAEAGAAMRGGARTEGGGGGARDPRNARAPRACWSRTNSRTSVTTSNAVEPHCSHSVGRSCLLSADCGASGRASTPAPASGRAVRRAPQRPWSLRPAVATSHRGHEGRMHHQRRRGLGTLSLATDL